MVEQRDRAALVTLFAAEPSVAGESLALGEDEAHHVRVRRLEVGTRVRVVDGAGTVGTGTLVRLGKSEGSVQVESCQAVEPPLAVHLLLPIADRERMLLLAEKACELGVSSWRPVLWQRSRSVTPRGEGLAFQAKVRARMIAALKQSGGAWLPTLYSDAPLDRAIAATPDATRLLLASGGPPILRQPCRPPVAIALGPEGGVEPGERRALIDAGFSCASLGRSILRFETAGIVAVGVIRAADGGIPEMSDG